MAPTELKIKGNKCFSHLSTFDTDEDLSKTWRLMTKVKDALEYGRRLENLSWRLWFMHHLIIHDQKRSKKYFRKLSTATTKKLETEKSTALTLLDTPNFKAKSPDTNFPERKGKKKAKRHASSAAQNLDSKKQKYALKQCSMPTSETFVKTDASQMDIDDKEAMSIQIPSSDSTESMTMSPTHSDMVMIQQGSPESTTTISTSDDSDMQLTEVGVREPVGTINDIYSVFSEDFLRGTFTDEHAFILHRYTTDQEETQSVVLQDSYVGYGSDFHSDVPSIGVSLNQLLRSVYNYSSDSSEPTSPTEMDLIGGHGYHLPSDTQNTSGLQYHLAEQMVAGSSNMSNAVYVPRSSSTPTVDTDLANNLMSVLGTPMNTPVTDIPSQNILASGMMYVNQYQSDQSTVQPISISPRQTNSTGSQSSTTRQSSKKVHSSGEQQCFNCGVTSTPLWRRSANDELLCNACGLYLKLHKMDRPKTMKPHIVRKDSRDEEAAQPVCTNCGTMTTPLWRRDEEGQTLCNACGLYYKLHHEKRPLSMKTDVIKKRQRYENGQNPNRRTTKKPRDNISNHQQQVSPPQSTSPTETQTQTQAIYPSIGVTTSPNPPPQPPQPSIGITSTASPPARIATSSMNVSSKISPISTTSI